LARGNGEIHRRIKQALTEPCNLDKEIGRISEILRMPPRRYENQRITSVPGALKNALCEVALTVGVAYCRAGHAQRWRIEAVIASKAIEGIVSIFDDGCAVLTSFSSSTVAF